MNTENIISIIQATGDTMSEVVFQIAMFFAIHQAAFWLSITFPCFLLYGLFMRVVKGAATEDSPLIQLKVIAYLLLAVTLFTGTRGVAHFAQAAVSPVIYVANEFGVIQKLLPEAK